MELIILSEPLSYDRLESLLGGGKVNDRAISLLEQYEIEVNRIRKGRGAFICETTHGDLIFKEYAGNEEKIAIQNQVLTYLNQK